MSIDPTKHLPPVDTHRRSSYCEDRALGTLSGCPSCTPDGGGCDQRYYSKTQCPVIAAYLDDEGKQYRPIKARKP